MNRFLAVTLTALGLGLAGCSDSAATAPNHDADVKALKDLEAQWNQDFAAKDAAKVAAHYTPDGVLMGPGAPAATTPDARLKMLTEMMADPAFSLKFQANRVDIAKAGDMGVTEGNYTMIMTDPAKKKPITDKGSYLTVYQKQPDGSWKAAEDFATSEVPTPAPEPPKKHSSKASKRH